MEALEMAKTYYPRLWSLGRLQALVDAKKLSKEEIDKLVAEAGNGTKGRGDEA